MNTGLASTSDRIGLTLLTIVASQISMSGTQTSAQKAILGNYITRAIIVFSISYISLVNISPHAIPISLSLAIGFVIVTRFILNENSRFSIIPEWFVEIK